MMERSTALPPELLKQWLAPILAIFWYGICLIYFRWPLTGGIMVLALVVFFPLILRWLNRLWPHRWSTIGAVTIVMVTSIAAASFMTSGLTRQLVTMASAGLLIVLLQGSDAVALPGFPGRLTLFTMTAAFWFGWLSLLSVSIFLSWPIWLLAGLAAVFSTAVAVVVWVDGGVPAAIIRRSWWLATWLGFELWLAIWFLPTSIFVGSVIATTTVMLWLQICRHTWLQTWRPDRGPRYTMVGVLVVLVTLLTARWI